MSDYFQRGGAVRAWFNDQIGRSAEARAYFWLFMVSIALAIVSAAVTAPDELIVALTAIAVWFWVLWIKWAGSK